MALAMHNICECATCQKTSKLGEANDQSGCSLTPSAQTSEASNMHISAARSPNMMAKVVRLRSILRLKRDALR